MKSKKKEEGKKHESAESKMKMMEKAMHGKNAGKGYKGYGSSKGCCK